MHHDEEISLNAALISNMTIGKAYKESEEQFIGLDFSLDGELLAAYTSSSLLIFEVLLAKKKKTLYNKSSGISHLAFTHHNSAVVFLPAKKPFNLNLWSIHENEIIKSFGGGEEIPIKLEINRRNDLVLTIDSARMIRVYDISKDQGPIMILDLKDQLECAACFDYSGKNLLVTTALSTPAGLTRLELHNIEDGYKGLSKKLYLKDRPPVSSVQFDPEGNRVLCVAENGTVFLINLESEIVTELGLNFGAKIPRPELSFTPDSKFLLAGSEEGVVRVIDISSKYTEIAKFSGHLKSCLCVKFSPVSVVFVSACQTLLFWTPKYWDS